MDCTATLADGILTLANDCIERRYKWNGGDLIGAALADPAGRSWPSGGDVPALAIPNHEAEPADGQFETAEIPANTITPACLQATATVRLGTLEVRRVFSLFPGCPAIRCELYLRGSAAGPWRSPPDGGPGDLLHPRAGNLQGFHAPAIETILLDDQHVACTAVRFHDATDTCNNLVRPTRMLPFTCPQCLLGNLLLVESLTDDAGMFLLKEAPTPEAQLAYPGCDFLCSRGAVQILGWGVDPEDLAEDDWVRAYGFVVGVSHGGERGLLLALRRYQEQCRLMDPERDEMLLVNTWGDRSQDTKIGEAMALAELDACAKLGATHFQLDDGWQKGRTGNSAEPDGRHEGFWEADDFWEVHPERFPNGLEPVAARARELKIQLALWFAPCQKNDYADWEKDAGLLLDYWRKHGIRTFKIDGVNIPTKAAETNLRAMLDRVLEESEGKVVFNLDATAGQRFGYHIGARYGNTFLENRYTDWSNYYPHWTLRNLWMLSRYVPPQRLQVEFLNTWRNTDNYAEDDPLAPTEVGFAYAFALTLAAQPLGWFEASNLPDAAAIIAPLARSYREHQAGLHAGAILPVGDEPSGSSWTGFQSIRDGDGYLLVYRERNEQPGARLKLWGLAGKELVCRHVLGFGNDFQVTVPSDGRLLFTLPGHFTFCLYRYTVVGLTTRKAGGQRR